MTRMGARYAARMAAVLAVVACCAVTLCAHAAPARAARPLTTALTDDVWFDGPGGWLSRTEGARAHVVLLELDWATAEPVAPPPGVNATDPAGPEYSFTEYDSVVREFAGSGITVAFLVTDAPHWAEAPGGPSALEADGAWKPNAAAFGQFATALARRYSGSYRDPLNAGRTLPPVRYFQAWGEANFSVHLAPQWVRGGGTWVPAGPAIYRSLLNAFYSGIKSVRSDDVVITTGFGPFGDVPGGCSSGFLGSGCRMPPAMFARNLFCLSGQALRPVSCPNPAHFDIVAMDPYQIAGPTTHAYNVDDISSADLGKLTRIVSAAVDTGRVVPRTHKQLWVTEFSYDSNPPNPTAVSLATQARWLAESFYLFWREGVSTVVWYLLRDQSAGYNPNNYYSGLYFYNGQPKPAFEAFRFPFVVWPTGRVETVWGISPQTGSLAIQRRQGRSWKTLLRLHVSAGSLFTRSISGKLRGTFRAVVNGEKSVSWNG